MPGNSLATLLEWMKDQSPLLGWGAIVALERDKANRLLAQEYIARVGNDACLPAITGAVVMVENQSMEYLQNFILDVPCLSFENADLNDSKAMLSLAIIGGSQVALEKSGGAWRPFKVSWIEPVEGPTLYLDLLLNEVVGDVDDDGRVILDLSKSENFRLTFAQTANEQRLGGAFFQTLFTQLPDEQRVYPLGNIERGTSELMRPQSFVLRTQANNAVVRDSTSPDVGRGAILVLVRMSGSQDGNYPGANSGFKYLIPDDAGKDYSATVLFGRGRLVMALLVNSVAEALGSDSFRYDYNDNKELVSATALGGELSISGCSAEYTSSDQNEVFVYSLGYKTFRMQAANALVVQVKVGRGEGLSVRWTGAGESALFGGIDGVYYPYGTITYAFSVVAEYELVDQAGGGALERTSFNTALDIVLPEIEGMRRGGVKGLPPGPSWGFLKIKLIELISEQDVETIIESALNQHFSVSLPINKFVEESIKLNFGEVLQGTDIRAPYDIGFFGQINPALTSFVVNPMQPLMKHGAVQQFTTEPMVTGLEWYVESLTSGSGNTGSIDSSGLYRAPAAELIEGAFARVRVTATDPGTGYSSSALATIVLNELTVNPLIQTCGITDTVALWAGALGDEVRWSIKNPVAGESGTPLAHDTPEGGCTYIHGPVVAGKTYVLDEIEVENCTTGQTRSAYVLAFQATPLVTVSLVEDATLPEGQVQLQASINGSPVTPEWRLPLGGPGSIDSAGLYRVSPGAKERFALIMALVADNTFGPFEGHMILPLPLTEFPMLLQTISRHAND